MMETVKSQSARLMVLLCLLLAASPKPGAPGSAPPDDRVLRAVVQLVAAGPADQGQNQECSATGFLIDEDGYLITNGHVVQAAKTCLENAPRGKILAKLRVNDSRTAPAVPCEVVGVDFRNDLALLKTDRPLLARAGDRPPYAVLDAGAVTVGTTVQVSGYPAFSWEPLTQTGQVVWSGSTEIGDLLPNRSRALMMDILLHPGSSGSPVYRPGGGVIAVVDKRDSLRPNYSVAVSIQYAIELANRYGARWHGSG